MGAYNIKASINKAPSSGRELKATNESLIQILSEVNRSAMSGATLSEDEDLFKKGILDSLTIVQLIVAIEKKYLIKISSRDINYQSFTTLRSIEDLINSKLS